MPSPKRRKRSSRKKKKQKSPEPFVREDRAPRTPGRPYNPRTPTRSTGGRPKGKGKKHIVGQTPGGRDYYCGKVPRMRRVRRKGTLEPRRVFRLRRLRKLELSLRLCEKERRLRRRVRSRYDERSNELWNATVRSLMKRYATSLRTLKYNPDRNRLLKRLRGSFGHESKEEVDDLADMVARKLFVSK